MASVVAMLSMTCGTGRPDQHPPRSEYIGTGRISRHARLSWRTSQCWCGGAAEFMRADYPVDRPCCALASALPELTTLGKRTVNRKRIDRIRAWLGRGLDPGDRARSPFCPGAVVRAPWAPCRANRAQAKSAAAGHSEPQLAMIRLFDIDAAGRQGGPQAFGGRAATALRSGSAR